ncbi:BlaI/MecI/CopY family transcriptional regulator [Protofrankia symbiont of Coriaria ruscifolia]|uniref:BlaI/MecI/CopY family transcriptional regulator n=1 Tax=Protofrankia symbiont of Coriaria ruscifolia TaxID=1306542 RepID=UPI0013EF7324|nr:BlaI/MecI/CopY family transcriptional regulator [Protofrankia symbiont of Coriaria ruscifolia]
MLTTLSPEPAPRDDDAQQPTDVSGTAMRRQPGQLEAAVLAVVWAARAPVSTGDIQQELGGGLAHSTIATTLARLIGKGHVERVRIRRVWMYHPTRRREEYAAAQMLASLEQAGDPDAALGHFTAALPLRQARLLRMLLEAAATDTSGTVDTPGTGGPGEG